MFPLVTVRRRRQLTVFKYTAGDSLTALNATTTRASSATYIDANGIVQTALTNVARDAHYIGGVRTLLLEGQRTNSAIQSATVSNAAWGAGFTFANATSIISGQTAQKCTDPGGGSNALQQVLGTFVNGQTDCFYAIVELPGTNAATVTDIGIRDGTAAGWACLARFTWSTHTIAVTLGSGTVGVQNLSNGRYLIWVTATGTAAGTGAAGNSRSGYCYPSGTTANTAATIVHQLQFEAVAAFPSSVIVTTTTAVTRSADVCFFPFAVAPSACTVYVKWTNLGTASVTDARIVAIENGSNGAPEAVIRTGNTGTKWTHYESASNVEVQTASFAALNDVVEHRAILNSDGSVQLGQSLNGGAESLTSASLALALSGAWSGQRLYVNGSTVNGFAAFQSIKIANGLRTLAQMEAA